MLNSRGEGRRANARLGASHPRRAVSAAGALPHTTLRERPATRIDGERLGRCAAFPVCGGGRGSTAGRARRERGSGSEWRRRNEPCSVLSAS
jgi:hypothetical protein